MKKKIRTSFISVSSLKRRSDVLGQARKFCTEECWSSLIFLLVNPNSTRRQLSLERMDSEDEEIISRHVAELYCKFEQNIENPDEDPGEIYIGPIHFTYIARVLQDLSKKAKKYGYNYAFAPSETHMKEWVRYIEYRSIS